MKESLKTDAFIAGKTRKERSPGALGIKTAGVYSFISKYVEHLHWGWSVLGTEDIGGEHGRWPLPSWNLHSR